MPLRPTSTMVQEHNPDGQSPLHDPQNGGSVNPVPASHFGQTPAFGEPPPAPGDHQESWLLDGGGAPGGHPQSPSEPSSTAQGQARAGDESWLMSGEIDEGLPSEREIPVAAAPAPSAGDAPEILEASFVSEESGRGMGALMIPVGLGALAILGGFMVIKSIGDSKQGQEAPEAVAITESLHKDTMLVAPKSGPNVLVDLDAGSSVSERDGMIQRRSAPTLSLIHI